MKSQKYSNRSVAYLADGNDFHGEGAFIVVCVGMNVMRDEALGCFGPERNMWEITGFKFYRNYFYKLETQTLN